MATSLQASTDAPLRIGAVSERTGIPAPTLRAWERRYGVPAPARTASAYRLYDPSEVDRVLAMKDLCEHGLAPAEAAKQLARPRIAPEVDALETGTDIFEVARTRLVDAAVRLDRPGLELELGRAIYLGPPATVYDRILSPVLVRLGELWLGGGLSVAHEHLASESIGFVVRSLLQISQPADPQRVALLACFADEEHVIGLLGAGLRLTAQGFRTLVLGARTPPEALREAVLRIAPDLVGLSVTITPPEARVRELLDGYARACKEGPGRERIRWVVGGPGSQALEAMVTKRGGSVARGTSEEWQRFARSWLASPTDLGALAKGKRRGRGK